MKLHLNKQRINIGLMTVLAVFGIGAITSYITMGMPTAKAAVPYLSPIAPIQPQFTNNQAVFPTSLKVDAADNVYFASNESENRIYKYTHSGELALSFTITDQTCREYGVDENPRDSVTSGIAVGDDGSVYVAIITRGIGDPVNCIQKYDSNGQYIKQVGTPAIYGQSDIGQIEVDGTRLYVADNTERTIRIIDTISDLQVGQFGGAGTDNGQFGGEQDGSLSRSIRGIAVTDGKIFVNDARMGRVQVFDTQGSYLRQFNTPGNAADLGFFPMYSMTLSNDGLLRFGFISGMYTYSQEGIAMGGMLSAPRQEGEVQNSYIYEAVADSQGILYAFQGAPSTYSLLYRYESMMLDAPQYAPVDFSISDITESGARFSWNVDNREQYKGALTDYRVRVKAPKALGDITNGVLDIAAFEHFDVNYLRPGTEYELHVSTTNLAGAGPEAVYSFKTAGEAPIPAVLDPNGRTLTVNGEGFLQDPSGIYAAFGKSLVTLNDEPMKACSMGIGFTRDEIYELVGSLYPDVKDFVSDSRPCYLLFNTPDEVSFTNHQVVIMLGEDFDFSARGSVIINGGQEFIFNDNTGGENTNPSVHVNGSNPAAGTLELPKRLSFNGKATPGATVTVTVRSDPVVCTAVADSNGNWSCTLPVDLPAGAHTVLVDVLNPDSSTQRLGPYGITVAGNGVGGVVDSNTPLAPNTGIKQIEKIFATARAEKAADQRDAIVASVGVGVMVALVGFMTLYAIRVRKIRQ